MSSDANASRPGGERRNSAGASRSSTLGEGWHSNHHHFEASSPPGILLAGKSTSAIASSRLLALTGIVWDDALRATAKVYEETARS